MEPTLIDLLLSWFVTGATPTEQQFAAWIRSYRHRSVKINIDDLTDDLKAALNNAAGLTNDFKIQFYTTSLFFPNTGSNKVLYVSTGTKSLHLWVNGAYETFGGDDAKFTQNIPVLLAGGRTFGKYGNGSVIPTAGKTIEQVLLDALTEVTPPNYYAPTAGISIDKNSYELEVGETVNVSVSVGFQQNDAGAVSGVSIRKNGSQIGTDNPHGDAGVKVSTQAITYDAIVNYAQGPIKSDTAGNPYPLGRIEAGNVGTNQVQLRGFYRLFYGPTAAAPANSADVRALLRNRFEHANKIFLLDTGSVQRIFVVVYPNYMEIDSVIDLDALNANITSSYIVSSINVNDAGGGIIACKMAVMTNAVAYSSPHFHQITFK